MIRRTARALAGFLLVLLAGLPVLAQSAPLEIGVAFEFDAPGLTDPWPEADVKTTATEVQENLIVYLNQHFPFWKPGALWRFSGAVTGTQVVLSFEVSEANNFIQFRLTPHYHGVREWIEGLAPVDWIKPTDGAPDKDSAASVITAGIIGRLLEEVKRRKILDSWLHESVPIGVGAQWTPNPDDLHLVLPLDWNEHSMLSRSVFLLDCRAPRHHPVRLESQSRFGASLHLLAPQLTMH